MQCLDAQVSVLERSILAKARLRQDYRSLKTVSGVGVVLALTIALETGDIGRFETPGDFASYARTVDSRRESNGKKKGEGNAKCGNKYLAWAFIEAAHFAVRCDAVIKRVRCACGVSHKGLDRLVRSHGPVRSAIGRVDWTRFGTEGFLGLPTQPGAACREARRP